MSENETHEEIDLNKAECQSVAAHIYEYLDSEMTEDDALRMRRHVAECSPCLAEMSIEEMIKRVLKRSCAEKAPEHLRVAIHAQFTSIRFIE
ncbi:mycothiol system anti-sigma-R factor [Jonesia quinghaiensis]|uniref:mycothiol system anti-sigma-R factor n=1 Tax=Jonesia quinghaiensis TaxID=262806 RepID=UPI0003F5DAAC|nr:mycothiol system anti-sigma-R factor [Jonesia quinghaiensis]